ncbi:T9SS type A sorting domain-containing protein [Altibacter lentus]|uniref:T9SS type A sorting domain-containing protein n=1 Tax=Altibacter lentus TaxID=1223410 RepID=UPI000A0011E1|nr:T9SS type A sorting domain-containing protein [Altibacter lentus]
MRNTIILLAVLLWVFVIQAQDPAIQWQNTIGGSSGDFMTAFEATTDGGYIMGGYSDSNISGDKTENSNGALDIWIVKIDASGSITWQNTIGGSGDDYLLSIQQTSDGGYILGAGSDSNISGDKTENSRGGLDYWILKLDNNGAISWQKTYGGAMPDFDTYVIETSDGGYFVGGYSDSGVTGDKTDPSNGQRDYWALKLNSTGAIVWQNSIGGSMVERPQAVLQTTDGGYLLGGFSNSPVSGDKTEPSQGGNDYWIVKLDVSGNILWQNTIGGNDSDVFRDMTATADGGYILAGYSKSNISGDKTENSQGDYDYWILKINNTGTILWQNTIGGSGIDYPRDVKELQDGNIMVSGWSNSNISGDKTEASNGGYDFWLIKITGAGALASQNSIGGSNDESGPYLVELGSGDFVMACTSDSNISGDKADNSEGLDDYWVFKTSPSILGISENESGSKVLAFPNPTSGTISLNLGNIASEVIVTIINSVGQIIDIQQFKHVQTANLTIPGSGGLYFVTMTSSEGLSETIKVLKY